MKRCKHETARTLMYTFDFVNVFCDACQRGWCGIPYKRKSNHPSGRIHQPPKWVLATLDRNAQRTIPE